MSLIEITELLGNLGEFVGAIAVVATLIYLSNQVRDSGRAAQFTAVQANRNQRVDFFLRLRDSPDMAEIMVKANAGAALTEEQERKLGFHCAASWALMYAEWVQRELGTAGEFGIKESATLDRAIKDTSMIDFWKNNGYLVYPDKFVDYVDTKISREGGLNP